MHLATKSISIEQITTNLLPQFSFGRVLTPWCILTAIDGPEQPCSLSSSLGYQSLVGSNEGVKTLNNVSTQNQLITVADSNLSYVMLGDPQVLSNGTNIDFSAEAIAINTQCAPITQLCDVEPNLGVDVAFNCSPEFAFTLNNQALEPSVDWSVGTYFAMTLFNDSKMLVPLLPEYSTNPVYIGMVSIVDQMRGPIDPYNGSGFTNPSAVPSGVYDNSSVRSAETGVVFILLCNSTVYDATYSWANGSFKEFTKLTKSNASVAAVINGPQLQLPQISYSYFVTGQAVAVYVPTVAELVQKMANLYSTTVLGLVAGSFYGTRNLAEQVRTPIPIAAKVPYAPFYTLVVLNLLCAAIGLVIAILAISNRRAGRVTSLLSPWGLTAQAFESVPENVVQGPGDLFQESRESDANVVGVERVGTSNNWRFRVWGPNGRE
jgi:hypothetical protein